MLSIDNSGFMVFLTKVKSEQKSAKITMPSEINESYSQIRATDLSALLFKGKSLNRKFTQFKFSFSIRNLFFYFYFEVKMAKWQNMHDICDKTQIPKISIHISKQRYFANALLFHFNTLR